jgi:hypothetical protein
MPPNAITSLMTDEAFSAYMNWREQCKDVRAAYARWCSAGSDGSALRYAAYREELDREQRACDVYAAAVGRARMARATAAYRSSPR